jgi:hypothetical protein
MVDPFAYEAYRQQRVQEKLDAERASRITVTILTFWTLRTGLLLFYEYVIVIDFSFEMQYQLALLQVKKKLPKINKELALRLMTAKDRRGGRAEAVVDDDGETVQDGQSVGANAAGQNVLTDERFSALFKEEVRYPLLSRSHLYFVGGNGVHIEKELNSAYFRVCCKCVKQTI